MTFGFILGVQRRTFRDQDPVNIHAIDWEELLSARQCVFGNPPFVGAKFQTQEQREQTRRIASLGKSGGTLDYVTAWFIKAGEYVKTGAARIGFVSTNSITQGEQVGQLWPVLFDRCKLEIAFAHRTFAWGRTRGVRRTSISSLSAWTGGNKHGRINGSSVTLTLTVNRKKSAMP